MVPQFFYFRPHLLKPIVHVIRFITNWNMLSIVYILGQIVTWHYIPNPLDQNWPCTVINNHDLQLWICPFAAHVWAHLLREWFYLVLKYQRNTTISLLFLRTLDFDLIVFIADNLCRTQSCITMLWWSFMAKVYLVVMVDSTICLQNERHGKTMPIVCKKWFHNTINAG